MALDDVFAALPIPQSSGALPCFATAIISDGPHRLGKDVHGAAALLVRTDVNTSSRSAPLELEHLIVQYGVLCRVLATDGSSEESTFSLIRCRDADRVLSGYFLSVADSLVPLLGSPSTDAKVRDVVRRLVELFRALQTPSGKTVQGLWAELLLIALATAPQRLVKAWHAIPQESVDFSSSVQRIEVKSAAGPVREHYFALDQLIAPVGARVLVASVIASRAGGGVSVAQLSARARSRLGGDIDLMLKVDQVVASSLGQDWRLGLEESFDFERAAQSLAFYWGVIIPSVEPSIPSAVSDVRFRVDLTGVETADVQELQEAGGIFEASVPSGGGR